MRYIRTISQLLGGLNDELRETHSWLCDLRLQAERRVDTGQNTSTTTFATTLREAEDRVSRLFDVAEELGDEWAAFEQCSTELNVPEYDGGDP